MERQYTVAKDLVGEIFTQMKLDDVNDSERLLLIYNMASERDRRLIDDVLLCICGWSFETLYDKAGKI